VDEQEGKDYRIKGTRTADSYLHVEFPIKQIKMRNHAIFVYRNYGLKYLEKRPDGGMVALGKRSVW